MRGEERSDGCARAFDAFLGSALLYCAVLCCAVLCCAVLWYGVPTSALLHSPLLCYVLLFFSSALRRSAILSFTRLCLCDLLRARGRAHASYDTL